MWTYPSEEAAIFDALRLARGMTYKYAAVGCDLGGGKAVKVPREGYEDVFIIPSAGRDAVTRAVGEAVNAGRLWLMVGAASLLGEPVPEDLLSDDAVLTTAARSTSTRGFVAQHAAVTYSISPSELRVTAGGAVIKQEPMLDYRGP